MIAMFLLLGSFTLPTQVITFKNRGAEVFNLSLENLPADLVKKVVTVRDPHDQTPRQFVVLDTVQLFSSVSIYGEKWRKAEEVLFTCVDGYQPSIPVSRFLQQTSYLAVAYENGKPFEISNKLQNQENVPLGPLYLIWDNMAQETAGDASVWPYQIASVDLVRFKDKFPRISPQEGASEQVVQGFVNYRRHCFNCHPVRGQGGQKALDLTVVTQVHPHDWLIQYIADPRKLLPQSVMPALRESRDDWKQVADDILVYLHHMADMESNSAK